MKLSSIFTDHAVLQSNAPIKVFGEGRGHAVIEFLGETVELRTDADSWCVTLSPRTYGGPYEMKVTLNQESVTLRDLYVGEVWLAGGQSNMEMPLFRTYNGLEEAKHSENEKIRLFTVPRRIKRDVADRGWNFEPTTNEDEPWQICREESALHFSAIGYYLAKELCDKLGCAVGVISCNWGGKPIETFIGKRWFEEEPSFSEYCATQKKMYEDLTAEQLEAGYEEARAALARRFDLVEVDVVDRVRQLGVTEGASYPAGVMPTIPKGPYNPNDNMGILYDTMYSRIIPYGIKGIAWYQGESNRAVGYLEKYLLYMKCMRESFENPTLPFYAIELASFAAGQINNGTILSDRYVTDCDNWAFKREQQRLATETDENSYLVTSIGLGDAYDIHPKNKKDLSHRMALKVLKHTYGFDLAADHPTLKKAIFEGERVTVELNDAEGLYSPNLGGVNIYLADGDHVMHKAEITIEGERLILTSPSVTEPTSVRFAFDNYYGGTLIYNGAGLPLAPFCAERE